VEYLGYLGLAQTCKGNSLHECMCNSHLHFFPQTGFLALSDTNVEPGQSAIEEVPTIALHQHLFPSNSDAILVKLQDHSSSTAGWDTNWCVFMLNTVLYIDAGHQE
jgi:hypothetical protein